MLNSKFESLLSFLANKKILITTHNYVDLDGFTSCVVLKYVLQVILKSDQVFLFFSELTRQTKDFRTKFSNRFTTIELPLEDIIDFKEIEVIIIIDTNNVDQLYFNDRFNITHSEIPFIFLDHHFYVEKNYPYNEATLNIISDNYAATAEIIYELASFYNITLPLPFKFLLICSILL